MPFYMCAISTEGKVKHFVSGNWQEIEQRAADNDKPGWNVYRAANLLKPGTGERNKGTIGEIPALHADLDFKDLADEPDAILSRLKNLLAPPSRIVSSGGGYHVYWDLHEPIKYYDAQFEDVEGVLKRLVAYLGADPAPAQIAALMRLPGTHNRKYDPPRLCEIIWNPGGAYDLVDIEAMLELGEGAPLFTRRPKANGHAGEHVTADEGGDYDGPLDVEQRLADMRFEGPGNGAINITQRDCIASMLRHGHDADEAVAHVLAATKRAVADDARCASWDWDDEERQIGDMAARHVNNNPELSGCLPDIVCHKFEQALENGHRTRVVYKRRAGFEVRTYRTAPAEQVDPEQPRHEDGSPQPSSPPDPGKLRFKLTPLNELALDLDENTYLVDELLPIRGLVDIWGKAKSFKSFLTFDLMLHVAMGWPYRDRQVQQGTVIYCAFEGAHGYRSRKAAAFQHYGIEEGTPVPLHLMAGNANLVEDHKRMIAEFKQQLGDEKPIAVVLDTLNKSLFGSESSDLDMGKYVRAAEAIRDAFNCVVIIVHHCGYDDTHPRGHTSLPGAVDAQLKVTKAEEMIVTLTVEMMRDGPEEVEIASQLQIIDLGLSPTGRPRTSLTVMPHDGAGIERQRKWPPSLTVFHTSLTNALRYHGENYQADQGGPPVRAVDLNYVREQFYKRYVPQSQSENETSRRKARELAFARAVKQAQGRKLVDVHNTASGRSMAWMMRLEDEKELY